VAPAVNIIATALFAESLLQPDCWQDNQPASAVTVVSNAAPNFDAQPYAADSRCAPNMFIGNTNITSAGGVGTFDVAIAAAGRFRISFSSRGVSSWVVQDVLQVIAGAANHLAVLRQPSAIEIGRAPLVSPLIAIMDAGRNTVHTKANILVSLVSNGSRPHDWIRQNDMSPVMSDLMELHEGIDDVRHVIDGDKSTFHQLRVGANMSFDLRHRYNINKIKLQCAVVRDDFNTTIMRTDANGLQKNQIVTVHALRPINSAHITSVDLYTRDVDSSFGAQPWKKVQEWHTPPCTFDAATNKTSFRILQVSSSIVFARYVSVVVTSTVSGAAARVVSLEIFGGLAPVLQVGAAGVVAAGLTRECNGTIDFDGLRISDHLPTPPYYFDPMVARVGGAGAGGSLAPSSGVAALFAFEFTYDTGDCVTAGLSCVLSVFRQSANGGGQCPSCKQVQQVAPVQSEWFRAAASAVRISLYSSPSDGTAMSELLPSPSVQVLDAFGTQVFHNDIFITAAIIQKYADGSQSHTVATTVERTNKGIRVLTSLTVTASGQYVVRVSAGHVYDTSLPFTISHGSLSHMCITRAPRGGEGGKAIQPQPIIMLQDAAGNAMTSLHHVSVVFDVLTDVGDAAFRALISADTASRTAVASFGVATFRNISLSSAGTYMLKFSAIADTQRGTTNTSVLSAPFTVIAGAASRLSIVTVPRGCVARKPCVTQPVIHAVDAGGNEVRLQGGGVVSVTLLPHPQLRNQSSLFSSSGSSTQTWSTTLHASGEARFSNIFAAQTGAYIMHFTHQPLSTAVLVGVVSEVLYVSAAPWSLRVTQQPDGDLVYPQSGSRLLLQPTVLVTGADKRLPVDLDESWYMSAAVISDSSTFDGITQLPLGTTLVTARRGLATFTNLRIDTSAKCYRLLFALGTLDASAGFEPTPLVHVMSKTFQVSIGDPWQILIVREAMGVVVLGEVLSSQPIVQIADAAGNVMLTDSRSTVTASLINTPPHSCDDNDNGLTGRPDASVKINIVTEGIAAYQGLIITAASDCLQMRFSRLGLRSAETQSFVTVAAAPSHLILAPGFEPSGARPGFTLHQQPWLLVQDRHGNMCLGQVVDTWFVGADLQVEAPRVWQGLRSLPTTASLEGSTSQQVTRGGARFTDLRLDKTGVYRLSFQSQLLSAVSQEVVVQTGTAARLSCIRIPDGTRTNVVFEREPIVAIHDLGGNIVAMSNVPVFIYILQNSSYSETPSAASSVILWSHMCKSSFDGSVLNGTRSVMTEAGVARFKGLSFPRAARSVRLRFCASRMRMDNSFSEASFVMVDTLPFDIADSTHSIVLDRHPAQMQQRVVSVAHDSADGGDVAGQVFALQPVVRLLDVMHRNATWCGRRSAAGMEAPLNASDSPHTTSSVRFAAYDADADLQWTPGEFAAYSSAFGGRLSFEAIDTDSNGVIRKRELVEYMGSPSGTSSYEWRFVRYDTDLDSMWSRSEYAVYALAFGPIASASFDVMDLSKDGFLSDWELWEALIALPSHTIGNSSINQTSTNGSKILTGGNATDGDHIYCSVYVTLVYNQSQHNNSSIFLGGRLQAQLVHGVAVFTNLFISTATYSIAQGFSLHFSLTTRDGLHVETLSPLLHIIPAAPHHMIITQHATGIKPALPFEIQPQLYVADEFGNRVEGSGWIAAVLLWGQSQRHVPLFGSSNLTLKDGVVQFTDLSCKANGTFSIRFRFSDSSVPALMSHSITVLLGVPQRLALLQQPSQMVAGQYARVQAVVGIVDANDNQVPAGDIFVTVRVARSKIANFSRPSPQIAVFSAEGGLLRVSETERLDTSERGVARFTNLGVAAATGEQQLVLVFEVERQPQQLWNGSNVTLFPITSNVFNLTDPRGVQQLVLVEAPALDWAAFGGNILTVAPVIVCSDINGTQIDSDYTTRVNVSITQSLPCCGLLGAQFYPPTLFGHTHLVALGGQVIFTDLIIDKIGKHKLVFSAVSSNRASVLPATDDASGGTTVSGGVGQPFAHTPRMITAERWVIVQTAQAHSLQLVQEPWPGMIQGKGTVGSSGRPFAQQPGIILTDAGLNRISDASPAATSIITAALLRSPCSPLPACCGGILGVCLEAFATSGLSGNVEGALAAGGYLFTDLTINKLGSYVLVFYGTLAMSLRAAVSTNLQIEAGFASRIIVLRQPAATSPIIAGEFFDTSATVADDGGNRISNYVGTLPMVAVLQQGAPCTDAPNLLPVFKTATATRVVPSGGVSVFDQLIIDVSGACYSITFSLGSLRTVTSQSFLVVPGEAALLLLPGASQHAEPSGRYVEVDAGELLPPTVHGTGGGGGDVLIADKGGNRLYYSEGLLQVSLRSQSDLSSSALESREIDANSRDMSAALHGTLQHYASRGAARFADLTVQKVGSYRLAFEKISGSLAPTFSYVFRVVVGRPHALHLLVAPDGARAGYSLSTQPQIGAVDKAGNQIPHFGANNTQELLCTNTSFVFSGNTTERRWYVTAELVQYGLRTPTQLSPAHITACVPRTAGILCSALDSFAGVAAVAVIEAFNGKAQFTDLEINVAGSEFGIRFGSLDGTLHTVLSPALSVQLGAADRLAVLQQPAGAIAGVALIFQPIVMIVDRGGNRVLSLSPSSLSASSPSSITTVTVRLHVDSDVRSSGTKPGGGNNQTVTDERAKLLALAGNNGSAPIRSGLANFLSLAISVPVPKARLVFSASTLGEIVSEEFAVTLQATHLNLSVVSQVGLVQHVGSTLSQIEVQILDSNQWVVEAEEGLIVYARVSLPSISGVAVLPHLHGTTQLRCVRGRAFFTDLSLDTPHDRHTLEFVAPGLVPIMTSPFSVYAASHVLLLQQGRVQKESLADGSGPDGKVRSGQVLSLQPSLLLTDSSRTCSNNCAAWQNATEYESLLQSASNITTSTIELFPATRLTVRIKTGTGSRSGRLTGNTQAQLAPLASLYQDSGDQRKQTPGVLTAFVFTDLAVVGAYQAYVLKFECLGLPWPLAPAESAPFDVLFP